MSRKQQMVFKLKAFTCELCKVGNPAKISLNKHIHREHVRLGDKCYYCEQNVESISHITNHLNGQQKGNINNCLECGFKIDASEMSKDHMHWKHVQLSKRCEDPDNHTKDIDISLNNKCEKCDFVVHWMHSLKILVKANDKPSRKHNDEICQDMTTVHYSTVTKQVPFSESSRNWHATFLTKMENWRKK